ncbi:MAG: glycogen/starch synthase [Muribaculaceae bacterium]|nr:glycogen/starch synthase [Muribaculaceae bacterium]
MPDKAIDYIFEASWEVCNKVGGIYTVLSTKAKNLQKRHKDHIIFIGPDVWTPENPSPDFTESDTLLKKWRETALLPEGLCIRVGRWDIPGKPIAILVKFDAFYASKDAFYGHLWERWGVDSLHAYGDYDEACAFGRAAAEVICSLVEFFGEKAARSVAHFDEWTLGTGLLTVKEKLPQVATVFTTHATSIGRSICGNGKPLYDYLSAYDGDQMARELNMESKHSLEKTAARNADSFTTVSDVTAREAAQLLERTPDVVTPNGFEPGFVPAKSKFRAVRSAARERMLRVAKALTGLDFGNDTFIVATSGRCEYRNKGIDVFCDVIASLRGRAPRRVLAFVMVPAWSGEARPELRAAISEGSRSQLPDPVLTHMLHNYNEDPINARLHQLGFAAPDRDSSVTAIYVPCYLNGRDGIFDLPYYDILPGMDATVFPSYYEPWGYTPLESVAFGVPTVTTSLSGFGQWIASTTDNTFESAGAVAVPRTDSNYSDVVRRITDDLVNLMTLDENQIKEISEAARRTAERADWANFMPMYDEAYRIALDKHNK